MNQETVTISKEEYENLQDSQKWLTALEVSGVDNWDGIDYAYEIYNEMTK